MFHYMLHTRAVEQSHGGSLQFPHHLLPSHLPLHAPSLQFSFCQSLICCSSPSVPLSSPLKLTQPFSFSLLVLHHFLRWVSTFLPSPPFLLSAQLRRYHFSGVHGFLVTPENDDIPDASTGEWLGATSHHDLLQLRRPQPSEIIAHRFRAVLASERRTSTTMAGSDSGDLVSGAEIRLNKSQTISPNWSLRGWSATPLSAWQLPVDPILVYKITPKY